MTMGPAPMIMMDLISVLFGIGQAPGMCYPGEKSTGIGFVCIAQIGVGLRGEDGGRNPDCGASGRGESWPERAGRHDRQSRNPKRGASATTTA